MGGGGVYTHKNTKGGGGLTPQTPPPPPPAYAPASLPLMIDTGRILVRSSGDVGATIYIKVILMGGVFGRGSERCSVRVKGYSVKDQISGKNER